MTHAVLSPSVLEAIAHNLCSLHDFNPTFVAGQERFARAVITEYLRATSPSAAGEPASPGHDLRDAAQGVIDWCDIVAKRPDAFRSTRPDANLRGPAFDKLRAALAGDPVERLSADMLRSLPGGQMDDSTFEAVETALDQAAAPMREGEAGRWLTLPERVAALAAAGATSVEPGATYQARVKGWLLECFGPVIAGDLVERGDRFIEEALELLQSADYPPERVAALTAYVWGRPKGEPSQEVGGVMVTLAAYCWAHGLDLDASAETELARILQPEVREKIKAKQAAKPTGSALPVAVQEPAEGERQ